jgi:16S rRNA (guanine966-N2)-methyltransferase
MASRGLRIVAGELGGRRIVTPPGRATRPTSDRVREALFSILGPIAGLDVLDLFAGSGALGIEALSRGAASATFVESDPRALAAIRENIRALDLRGRSRVVGVDWKQALARDRVAERVYGLCLVDPPYSLLISVLNDLGRLLAPVLAPGARVAIERSSRTPSPDLTALHPVSRIDRTYGATALTVLRLGDR